MNDLKIQANRDNFEIQFQEKVHKILSNWNDFEDSQMKNNTNSLE